MPALEYETIEKVLGNTKALFPCFVETGTFLGETIFSLEDKFDELHTVEIKKEFYENAKNRYNGNKIIFHLGDSSYLLRDICVNLKQNAIFFLDGHWSAGNTGKGLKDCPLYEELSCIINNFKYEGIIIIDDVRLFGLGPNKGTEICNWEDINVNNILSIVKEKTTKHYFLPSVLNEKDRLIIHINI